MIKMSQPINITLQPLPYNKEDCKDKTKEKK